MSKNGYVRVELWENGKGKKYLLHRLIASGRLSKIHSRNRKLNHIDGNPLNNSVENLEWATQSENQLHAYRAGLQIGYKKPTPLSKSHKAALCGSRWKDERRIYHADGFEFDCPRKAAEYFGFNRQTFYNRAKSDRHPEWKIQVVREEK